VSEENIRKHLRAALDEVVTAKKAQLHKFHDDRDAYAAGSKQLMQPVIDALNALQVELGERMVLELSPTYHSIDLFEDQKAILGLGSMLEMPLSISTNYRRGIYYVENSECSSVEDVLRLVLDDIGQHIASKQVLAERKK
jgi:hypothetical protein